MAVPNFALRREDRDHRIHGNAFGVEISLRARDHPIRTSRIPPDVILTLVHSTRLLPWVVKIMSVPRSVSRAIPRPPLAVKKRTDNRLEPLTTVAP